MGCQPCIWAAGGGGVTAALTSVARLLSHSASRSTLSFQTVAWSERLYRLWWATSSIISREWQPNRENNLEGYVWTHPWASRSPFLTGLLWIVIAVFANFTSVKSHHRWNSSCERLTLGGTERQSLPGYTLASRHKGLCGKMSLIDLWESFLGGSDSERICL